MQSYPVPAKLKMPKRCRPTGREMRWLTPNNRKTVSIKYSLTSSRRKVKRMRTEHHKLL